MIKKHGGNVHEFAKTNNIDKENILDFSANINPFGISDTIEQQMKQLLYECLYYPDPNYTELKTSIAEFEHVDAEQIILGNGAIECIFLLAEQLKSKHVLLQAPTFVEYERAFSKYGSEVSYYELDSQGFRTDMNHFINHIPETTDTIIICNPNNPTGVLIERKYLLELLEYTSTHHINLIIDEAFIDFTDDEDQNTMKKAIGNYSNLFVLKSLTKFFAMPGLRLGYILTCNKQTIKGIRENRIPWVINSMAEGFAKISLKDQQFIEKTKAWIVTERKWLYDALSQFETLTIFPSQGNYLFFFSEDPLLDVKLKAEYIMIRNCDNYQLLKKGYFRVAIKDRRSNEKLLKCIEEILWKS